MEFSIIFPGQAPSDAEGALSISMKEYNLGVSYADTIRLRLSGALQEICNDTYYVAHENGRCISRLWNGWGRHGEAIGNFGNFLTEEKFRGQGIGKKMLELWFSDLNSRDDLPLGLFCTAGAQAAKLYFPYGFKPVLEGECAGPLYLPLGNSPEDFGEFCARYYRPTQRLIRRKASFEWRHEIDCLLKFDFARRGEPFGIGKYAMIEEALLRDPERTEQIFTQEGHCVGWGYDQVLQIHPCYSGVPIESV